MTHEENAADLAALQAIIERSTRSASPSVADSVAYPARQMTAAEFVEFWSSVRLVAMATVGDKGQPHLAPVHAQIAGTMLKLVIYDNTAARRSRAQSAGRVHHLERRGRGRDRVWSGARSIRFDSRRAAGSER